MYTISGKNEIQFKLSEPAIHSGLYHTNPLCSIITFTVFISNIR